MTAILGISAFYHDSAAALVVDGRIVAAAQEERFTRNQARQPVSRACRSSIASRRRGSTAEQLDYVGFYDKPFLKFERLLETYLAFAPAGFRSFCLAMPVWLGQKLHLPAGDSQGTGGPIPPPHRLYRASRIARRQRLLPLAVRRGGHPDPRRRRRVGHGQPGRKAAATASRSFPETPLSPFARPALLRLHLFLRLPRQLGRVQADGPGAIRRAGLRRPDPPKADRPESGRLVPHGHVVLPLLPGIGDDFAEVRAAVRRAAATRRRAVDATGNGHGRLDPAGDRGGHAPRRAALARADGHEKPLPGRRRCPELRRQRANPARRPL